jgi:chromosome segregation ATPase
MQTAEDCGFFRWLDEESSEFMKELLRDLRDAVWGLKKELGKKEALVDVKDMQLLALQKEMEGKQKEVQDKQQELQTKAELMQALQAQINQKNSCIDILVVLCLILLMTLVVIMLNG